MPEDESSLERMRERLYAQKAPAPFAEPHLSAARQPMYEPEVANKGNYVSDPKIQPPTPRKKFSWTVLFLGVSILFFVLALGASFLFLVRGGRTVSNDNLIITVQGPTTIASGTSVPLVVTIQNKNPAAISDTSLTLNFPDGTRSADNVTQPLVRYTDTLGTIPPGGTVTRTVQAVLFGSVNQAITIPIDFQYNTPNSNALFEKKQDFASTITSSPLTITANTTGNVASGQPFTIALTVRSNAVTPLDNIAVDAQYPFGFSIQKVQTDSTIPNASFFSLGTISPGEQKTINITGTLNGTDSDQRDFNFTVGTQKNDGSKTLEVAYASEATNVTISKPFISVALSLNHESNDTTIVSGGDAISGLVTWANTLSTAISGGQVTIKLSGNALNPASVSSANGYYDSSRSTILFSSQNNPGLGLLNPGDTGNGQFTLSTKTGSALNTLRNPTIQVAVSVSGLPTGGSPESITNTLIDTIKVATNLELNSQIVHSTGPFPNSGPWPPIPNQPTLYTMRLGVTNTVNSVGGATATMILPSYVTYTGKENASTGELTYDDASRTVTWKVGDVAPGTGTGAGASTQPITAAFQVSFIPSVSQTNMSPILVGNQTFTGTDRFTSAQVGNTAPALTTQTVTDPAYQPTFGTVGK